MKLTPLPFNAETDLLLERVVDVPRERVWRAWTEPALLMQWFCPLPWKTVECEIDLRPGGNFNTVMQSPEGERFPNAGCYLEVVPQERLVWTDALVAGFRPSARGYLTTDGGFYLTAALTLTSIGDSTRYIGQVVYLQQGVAGNVPFAAAFSLVPIVVIGVYLWLAKRMGAFDAL